VPSSSSHSLLTFPSSSLPFHNISSSVASTVLRIQRFLKPFTVTSGEIHCHAVVIHVDLIIHLYFVVYKPTWTCDSQFSLHVWSGLLCYVCLMISLSSLLFLCVLICWMVQVLFLSFVVNFFDSHFTITTLDRSVLRYIP
jgi:hypothetical protein